MSDFHRSSQWVKLRAQLVVIAKREDAPCAICGYPIDYTASGREAWGPSIDHAKPVSLFPELALDPSNCRPVHRSCNTAPTAREVAAHALAMAGHSTREDARRATRPSGPTNRVPEPWQHAYAARMAAETGDSIAHYLSGNPSRPWLADWTVAAFEAGLVGPDGYRR